MSDSDDLYPKPIDWANVSSRKAGAGGGKGKQTPIFLGPTGVYRTWRWDFGHPCYATDIDFIEERPIGKGGVLVPIGVFELTAGKGTTVSPNYLSDILARYYDRDNQAETTLDYANRLTCPAYILTWSDEMQIFYCHCLSYGRDSKWWIGNRDLWEDVIRNKLIAWYLWWRVNVGLDKEYRGDHGGETEDPGPPCQALEDRIAEKTERFARLATRGGGPTPDGTACGKGEDG